MAGIGFELKKMFHKKGLLSMIRAYGYAGIVCIGPMILGVLLLLGVQVIATMVHTPKADKDLLNSMITYTLLASLILTNIFSLVTTRFTADQLYEDKKNHIMPSFWGGITFMLAIGVSGYGIFLFFSGISLLYGLLCIMFFSELIIVWTEINYLTAIKDYRGIIVTFFYSVLISWITGGILVYFHMPVIVSLFFSVYVGYGVMMVMYYFLLLRYFPTGRTSMLYFLRWFDRYPQLAFIGVFISAGLFGHIVLMWGSPIGVEVKGLFFGAPIYDISALLAFFSILITTINFVTSVEVNFYPKYKTYFSLFNDGGSFMDIEQAQVSMKSTLFQELTYTFTKQFFATIVFIILGSLLIPYLPLGITEDVLGIYRVLCVAYAFYAIGNCTMLIQLYFSDNKGACISTGTFFLVSIIGTMLTRNGSIQYYGVGFLAGSIAFTVVSLFLLLKYMKNLMYEVLCNRPLVSVNRETFITKISNHFQKKYMEKYRPEDLEYEEELI